MLRWNKPGTGFVPPDCFIPVAESSGLIVQLGAWVVAEACRQIALWHRQGYGWHRVAINVSAQQIFGDDLPGMIRSEARRHAIAPSLIEVEVTESFATSNLERSLPIMQALRDMGVTIAIDDFGTGHSSLAYLRQLPVDVLKIDRSFVRDAQEDHSAKAIVMTILALGQTLNLTVVAEGVETAEQAHMLRAAGCQILQGYYFAKPLPASAIEAAWENKTDSEPQCASWR